MAKKTTDIQEFEQLFYKYRASIKQYINSLIKSEEDADDITQDVFASLWAAPHIWMDNPNCEGYMRNMAKWMVLDLAKHRSVERKYQDQVQGEWELKEFLESDEQMIDSMYYKEVLLQLKRAVRDFPEQRKKIFRMSRLEHLTNQEIADDLEISVRTVERQIHLALNELRKFIFMLLLFRLGIFG